MFTLDTQTEKEILIKKIEDEITDILSQFGRVRRLVIHYILANKGFISAPGEDGRKFQTIIDAMERKGMIVMQKSRARGTFIELAN
jgi:hypothetical protein